MKPRNFPERKNARRKKALMRMAAYDSDYKCRDRDIAALHAAIVMDARDVRTKKHRATR